MATIIVPDAGELTQVLLLHAPFPGKLKFGGQPSSLLNAVAPFAHRLAASGRLGELGIFDPGEADDAYGERLAALLRSPALRVLCISTSSAAIGECARAVHVARQLRGDELLVVVGGPHEDDVDGKVATRIAGVDLSLGGDVEFVLDFILHAFLDRSESPERFLVWLRSRLGDLALRAGDVTLAGPWLGSTLALQLPAPRAEDLAEPVWSSRRVRFSVFDAPETLPVMVSRGCAYGRCTFCAEANRDGVLVRKSFTWLEELARLRPEAAIYFQDSILPGGDHVERELLPLLHELGRPWGCQVYLRTLARPFLERLARHGCRYVYTGLETASPALLAGVGKARLSPELALERLRWMRDLDMQAGISLMFGCISVDGRLLETEATIDATVALADAIVGAGVPVAGFYPNVMTVLPGTALARGLENAGFALDFYRPPRSAAFDAFEDGGVGFNLTTIPGLAAPGALVRRIVEAAQYVQTLGLGNW